MKFCRMVVLFVLVALCATPRAASVFEDAYMVAANGSTVPVADFALDGPVPWLYVNLAAAPTGFTFLSAALVRPGAATPTIVISSGSVSPAGDEYWFAPTPQEWAAKKALGPWNAVPTLYAIDLILIYGVGVGSVVPLESLTTGFSVVTSVPEPSAWLLLAAGLGVLAWRIRSVARR